MNRTMKVILVIVGVIFSLCLCSAVAGILLLNAGDRIITRTFQNDPVAVSNTSEAIAEYTLPDGFDSSFAAQVAGISAVGYTGSDGHSHIYLASLPRYMQWIQGEVERQLREATDSQSPSHPARMEIVDRTTVTIRDQDITMLVSEGMNHDNQTFRQVSGVFEGQNGPTMIVFERPVSQWDQAEVDNFLASIK